QAYRTTLKEGCYTVTYVPKDATFDSYKGTLRVENVSPEHICISGDLYTHSLLQDILAGMFAGAFSRPSPTYLRGIEQAALGGVIPIYPRKTYYSYLKGVSSQLSSPLTIQGQRTFTLTFDEFCYQHPLSGFNGSFDTTPTRQITFLLRHTADPDHYIGDVLE